MNICEALINIYMWKDVNALRLYEPFHHLKQKLLEPFNETLDSLQNLAA